MLSTLVNDSADAQVALCWHSGIDVSRILTPAASLRPGAAQTCQLKQDHGLETGLDLPELISAAAAALPEPGTPPQPVYYETTIANVNRHAALHARF